MSTKITRAVTRETADTDPVWGKTLMVRLEEGGRLIRIWQKGRRTRFAVTYADLWRFAFQNYARAALVERKKAKAARRKERQA